jgi:hypothetical protein
MDIYSVTSRKAGVKRLAGCRSDNNKSASPQTLAEACRFFYGPVSLTETLVYLPASAALTFSGVAGRLNTLAPQAL